MTVASKTRQHSQTFVALCGNLGPKTAYLRSRVTWLILVDYTVWVKKILPFALQFSDIFHKRKFLINFYTPIIRSYLRLITNFYSVISNFDEVRDYLVHIICSKCPPSAERHAFRRLWKSLIALLIVACGTSFQICCFYNVNKYVICSVNKLKS